MSGQPITTSIDLLEKSIYYVDPHHVVSPVPLVFATFHVEQPFVAFTKENTLKLARSEERKIKEVIKKVAEAHQSYLMVLDQDQLLETHIHLREQAALVDDLLKELQAIAEPEKMQLLRLELAGSWPMFQTQAGLLDLNF